MKNLVMLLFVALFVMACSNDTKSPAGKNGTKQGETTEVSEGVASNGNIDGNLLEPPYQVKEDGLYIYADGPALYEKHEDCKDVVQKNYKYIRVPSSASKIKTKEGARIYQNCAYQVTCEDNLGKPTLHELGYERHKEREIKPEDSRFGVEVKKPKVLTKYEKKLAKAIDYDVIPEAEFKVMSRSEFINNGIVIIGKHVSRVVIKSLAKLPKFKDEVAVGMYTTLTDCSGKETKLELLPEVIADFKKIQFKENVFEFIEENAIPNNRAYLSDEHYQRLINNIHQLIPRVYDKTIHNVANYSEGYYVIEYYNGDVLNDYQCIKLSGAAAAPKLWEPLEKTAPGKIDDEVTEAMFRLVLGDFATIKDAENFIYKNQLSDVLIYRGEKGASIGATFNSQAKAENEMKRYINRGFKKDNMRIEKY